LAGLRIVGRARRSWGFVDVASDCPASCHRCAGRVHRDDARIPADAAVGDLAISIAGPSATQADVEIVRKAYGLDRPLYVQFFAWTGRALVGDFGQSYFFKDSVANLIQKRLPITVTLGLVGLSLALVISIPLGILAALRENTWVDRGVTLFTMVGAGGAELLAGADPDDRARPAARRAADLGHRHLAAFRDAGDRARLHGDPGADAADALGMIEAMASDYIRTARAKGLSRARIIFKHALRNAAIPVVSIAAVQLGFMLGGSIVIETVFALHGVGYLGWESIAKNDFPSCRRWCWCSPCSISASRCWPTSSTHCSIRGCARDERADCHSGAAAFEHR
jgi:peptide/nickel transport system permease protein